MPGSCGRTKWISKSGKWTLNMKKMCIIRVHDFKKGSCKLEDDTIRSSLSFSASLPPTWSTTPPFFNEANNNSIKRQWRYEYPNTPMSLRTHAARSVPEHQKQRLFDKYCMRDCRWCFCHQDKLYSVTFVPSVASRGLPEHLNEIEDQHAH